MASRAAKVPGHRVKTGTAKRMTLPQPAKAETDSDDDAVAFDGLCHVVAAGGKEPTRTCK